MSKKIYFQYTPPLKTAWDDLPINEKADIMKSCVRNGIISPQDIRTAYNNYAAGRNILEGIPDYQANATEFGNFLAGGGRKDNEERVIVHQPYYAYDENGNKIDDILYYNVDVTLPEVTIIPDSMKSPAQRNEDERLRQRFNRNYAEQQARDYTTRHTIAAQREWENSPQKKALDLGIAATQGIGMASDVVSPFFGGIPVYSGLKGAQALNKATSTHDIVDYADAALWLSPMLTVAGKKVYDTVKPAVQTIVDNGGFAFKNPFDDNIVWVGKGLGSHIELSPTKDGWLGVDYIESTMKGNGRRLYDAAIKEAQRRGYKGVKTGTSLASAPKTYNIWKHYPDKTFLGNYGSHGNGNMINGDTTVKVGSTEELIEATKQGIDAAVIRNAPVYGLTTPSRNVPFLSFSKAKNSSFASDTPAVEWTLGNTIQAMDIFGRSSTPEGISIIEMPVDKRKAATQRMMDFINSQEYQSRLKKAGMEDGWDAIGNYVEQRVNGENYFPAKEWSILDNNPDRVGSSNVSKSAENYGVNIKQGVSDSEFKQAIDHELSHWSTGNLKSGNLFNRIFSQTYDVPYNPVIGKIMSYNKTIAPTRSWEEFSKEFIPKGTPEEVVSQWKEQFKYISDIQEIRANAYAMFQEAKRQGLTTEQFVDKYIKNGRVVNNAPEQLENLSYVYKPNDLKKFMKEFLSISSPVTIGLTINKHD